jgi:hypothetical protein
MREQIKFNLPRRIGGLIQQGLVQRILVKSGHRDIEIIIQEDTEFIENEENNVKIDVSLKE